MSNRQLFFAIAGLSLAAVGLLALWFPVYLDQYDQYGIQITCGRGLTTDLTEAEGDGQVPQCGTALLIRRAWAIPATVAGVLLFAAFLAAWVHGGQPEGPRENDKASPA